MIRETGNVAHYARLENLANILHDKRLKLGSVSSLVDPRESSLGWIDTVGIGYGPNPSEWEHARRIKNSVGKNLRILCTAGKKERILEGSSKIEESIYGRPRMWSQYGDNSKGFCIVLNISNLNKAMSILTSKPEQLISDVVYYCPWLHDVSCNVSIEYGDSIDLSDVDIFEVINRNSILRSLYFKKNIDWEGENEFRWLLYSEEDDITYVSIENAVEAVVVGCDFPLNQLPQVKEYCKGLGCLCYRLDYQHPQYSLNKVST